MAALPPDSYDFIRTTVHPFELPPLDGTSVMHPEDISVSLDGTVSVLTRGILGLPSPLVLLVVRAELCRPLPLVRIHPIFWIWVIRRCVCWCRSFEVAPGYGFC